MNTHFLFIEVGYEHGSENLLVARLRIELLRPVDDGIGHLQAGHGKSHARHKIGDKLLLFYALTASECVSVKKNVMRNGPPLGAQKEVNAQTAAFRTVGALAAGDRAVFAARAYEAGPVIIRPVPPEA